MLDNVFSSHFLSFQLLKHLQHTMLVEMNEITIFELKEAKGKDNTITPGSEITVFHFCLFDLISEPLFSLCKGSIELKSLIMERSELQ